MRWYLILGNDVEGSLPERLWVRPDHVARLKALNAEGRLKLAGPLPAIDAEDPGEAGFTGSALVVAFEDIDAARVWVSEDPYVTAGVYESVAVFPFKPVLP